MLKPLFILLTLLLGCPLVWSIWYASRLPELPKDLYGAATPRIQSCDSLIQEMERAYEIVEAMNVRRDLGMLTYYSDPRYDDCEPTSFTYFVETDTPDPDRYGWRLMEEHTVTLTDLEKVEAFRSFLLDEMANLPERDFSDFLKDLSGLRSAHIGFGLIRDVWGRYQNEPNGVTLASYLKCGYPLQRRDFAAAYRHIFFMSADDETLGHLMQEHFPTQYQNLLDDCFEWKTGINPIDLVFGKVP